MAGYAGFSEGLLCEIILLLMSLVFPWSFIYYGEPFVHQGVRSFSFPSHKKSYKNLPIKQ